MSGTDTATDECRTDSGIDERGAAQYWIVLGVFLLTSLPL